MNGPSNARAGWCRRPFTDGDPAKNHYNLDGGDTAPTGLSDQATAAEIVWDVEALLAAGLIQEGRAYRVQFMMHDGAQNKIGGDHGRGLRHGVREMRRRLAPNFQPARSSLGELRP